jgi:hypothetical protein
MTQHANKIIKSIEPSAIIISPAPVAEAGATWMKTFLADGGGAYVDVIAFHGYWSSTAEDIIKSVTGFQAAMKAEGASSLPLWDTEASWGASNNAPSVPDPNNQASFLAKYFLLQWSEGVSRFVWYGWDAATEWGQLWNSTSGIDPAGVAYQETYNWMVGSTLVKPCSEDASGDWSCGFSRSGDYASEALWNSTANTTLKVASTYTKYVDLTGAVHTIVNNTVPVGNSPILLEN